MYRDDPLDDEAELRAIVGDDGVDRLVDHPTVGDGGPGGGRTPLLAALDVLRVLQGWVDDDEAGRWFDQPQRRLDGRTPLDALTDGDFDDVEEAARAFAAANG